MVSKGFARCTRAGIFGSLAMGAALMSGTTSAAFAQAQSVGPSQIQATRAAIAALDPSANDSLGGKSGKLLARIFGPKRDGGIRVLERLFGDSAARHPGVYAANDSTSGRPFSFITLIPFGARTRGRLGDYRIGFWPGERNRTLSEDKAPEGFIEVTSNNQDTPLSEHFRLRDFLTHDQQSVWPKYLVIRESLIDKLELLIDDLRSRGVAVSHLSVMSGFRTPQYNIQGVGRGGRAKDSRHQYGDAADVFVDNDGDGRMDDLNHDGRVDIRDAKFLLESVERVEMQHPELIGGAGLYRATRAHGPFVHVDTRGSRARWGRG